MKPLNSTLVCVPHELKDKNELGLILPKKVNYKVLKVVAIDEENIKRVAVDDIIYVPINAPFEVPVDGNDYLVVKINDVLFVV